MTVSSPRALVWGVKASFVSYVRGAPGGLVLLRGAREDADGFLFPGVEHADDTGGADPLLRFDGEVEFRAHDGMLRVVIADPWLDLAERVLTIRDPDDASARLRFATLPLDVGTRRRGTTLTEEGADLFFGPYSAGTALDEPVVRACTP